jgi:hypothetical protein
MLGGPATMGLTAGVETGLVAGVESSNGNSYAVGLGPATTGRPGLGGDQGGTGVIVAPGKCGGHLFSRIWGPRLS